MGQVMFSTAICFVFQENSVKIVMVGDSGVGKSCLLGKWTKFTLTASGVDMIRIPHAFFLPDFSYILSKLNVNF